MSMPASQSGAPAPSIVPPPDPASTARGFLQRLEGALKDLVTLKVVTVVGDVSVSGSGGDIVVAARDGAAVEAASTEIDLLDGHIVNIFSPKFSDAGGGTLQAFHQTQVEKSNAIMAANLLELQKLAAALTTMRR
jgi:hypothetical protein